MDPLILAEKLESLRRCVSRIEERRAESAEARRQDRSAAWLAKQAIEGLKRSTEAKRLMIREAVASADQGSFVSQQAVHKWLDTWDTEHESAPPKPDVHFHRS